MGDTSGRLCNLVDYLNLVVPVEGFSYSETCYSVKLGERLEELART